MFLTLLSGVSMTAQTGNPPCPAIEIAGGGVVRPGDPMSFSVKEAENLKLEYEWTVSEGTIVEGRNGSSIKIDTTGLGGRNITATVKIKGLPANCADTASEIGSVIQTLPLELYD
ncbi:MAG: hypothetical protein JSS81_24510 [Acidobacteria bacterium]|nr:hypothetical protein [Acidobacteriota bacterium]